MLGTIQSSSPINVSQSPVLIHLNSDGSLNSCWRIDLNESSNINGFFRSFLCQIEEGFVDLLVNYTTEDVTSAFITMKIDIASGNCIWTNRFFKNNFFYVNGLIGRDNELIIASNFSTNTSSGQKQGINLIKLNALTGSLLSSKSYENKFATNLPGADYYAVLRGFNNGNIKLVFSTSKENEANKIVSTTLDNDFNILKIAAIGNVIDNYLVRNYSINDNGFLAFSFFNASNINDQGYIAIDSAGKLVQQRKLKPPSSGIFTAVFSNNDINLTDENKLTVFASVNNNSKMGFECISTNIYNKDTGCATFNFNEAVEEDFSLQNSAWGLDQEINTLPFLNSYTVTNNSLFIHQQQVCLSVKNYDPVLPDKLTKCNDDSLILKANSDFTSYNWEPGTFQIRLNDSTIKVYPSITQNYVVTAQTYWGCEMKDTTTIIAAVSSVINLGNDSSLCEGSAINLDAGNNFINYLWNDGSTEQFKKVFAQGIYFVQATNGNGCSSSDTFNVVKVYEKPLVNIHQRQVLCKGQSDVLSPGSFDSYLWQDGSTAQHFVVNGAGRYWVSVIDQNKCTNSDTVLIAAIADPPSDFMVHDTSICEYETIELKPVQSFSNYLWNNGSATFSILVNKSGTYWLQVNDVNGCTAKEFITVDSRACVIQIFFPSAFTPNGDGKNDLFKPVVRGPIEEYELLIFDRWGQRVFATKDVLQGWNGTISTKRRETGIFIWLCKYKFKDQQLKIQKGSFVLVR
jgi:gliding motility-associated-like protein